MITPHTMTWFKKVVVDRKTTYEREVVPSVAWQAQKAANTVKSGMTQADSANIYVPRFVDGIERTFEFHVEDYVTKGEVPEEITDAFTPTMLIAKYPDTVKITSVDTKDYGSADMQHWQLGGR